jgi:hypothetical protein
MSTKTSVEVGGGSGCGGCLSVILFVLVLWALLFGVTLDGKHYGLDLSCNDGVTIHQGESLDN